ncbi:uncharacterized protein LOC116258037 isoform X2 [Nymphaea colorata]|uniref:uncharacterized protein LOC116258037 isoform X2 n=1 Tax=Nymphaea colorata TaxID=210225 RepID=UPI00129E604B|nr:uncharacterized protein LOC116258037 isoform X2 [Nymphaea colorata]
MLETSEMMSAGSPKHGATIMPSSALLWRLKVLLFLLWGFICCKIGVDSVIRMNADLRDLFLYEVFLYYNPMLLVVRMHLPWWTYSRWHSSVFLCNMDDHYCSDKYDCIPLFILSWRSVFGCFTTSIISILSLVRCMLDMLIWVLLYTAVFMVLIFPFDIFYLSSRYFFLKTLWRIILPLQPITFADFFIADILTSMSKVLSDLERSVCRMVHRQVATIAWFEADSVCGSHSVAIPLVLVLPYICRFFQCIRQYKDTKEKTCLFNALKYSTAVPVVFLSALKYHVFPESWVSFYRPMWLFSSVVNSLYSFYWDVKQDWDLSVFSKIFKFKAPTICSNLLYGHQWVYYWAIGSNLILRCTWTYKLSAHLRHNYLTVFTITALEIFRRFQWIFFRVENEWNKMAMKQGLQASMSELPTEEDKLLGSTNHNV